MVIQREIQSFDETTKLVQRSMDVYIIFTKKHEDKFSATLKQIIKSPLKSYASAIKYKINHCFENVRLHQ